MFGKVCMIELIYLSELRSTREWPAADSGPGAHTCRKLNGIVVGGLALAPALVVLDAYVLNEDEQTRAATRPAEVPGDMLDNSVAVLSFEKLSPDPAPLHSGPDRTGPTQRE